MLKAAIHPFNKITHGLIRFRDLLEYEVKSVIDFTFSIGKDAGEEVDGNFADIKVTDDIDAGLEGVDVLILSDGGGAVYHLTEFYKEHDLARKWKNVVAKAHEKGIKIISIHELSDEGVLQWKEENNIEISDYLQESKDGIANFYERFAEIQREDSPEEIMNRMAETKRIAIFGTRSCLGKYTMQMYLYRELKKRGKKATALITEPTGPIFKLPDTDWGRMSGIMLPLEYPEYLNAVARTCEKDGNEYLLIADQRMLTANDTLLGPIWKLSILKMFNPNIVLFVSGYDDDANIKNCMDVLRIYGDRKVPFAILIPDKIEVSYGDYEVKTAEQIEKRKAELKEKFGIKNVECIRDVEKITDLIINCQI